MNKSPSKEQHSRLYSKLSISNHMKLFSEYPSLVRSSSSRLATGSPLRFWNISDGKLGWYEKDIAGHERKSKAYKLDLQHINYQIATE